MTTLPRTRIIDSRHPSFLASQSEWDEWRITYRGGREYRQRNLKHFSTRETEADFADRMQITPVPSFAKAAVNDIRNAIFQRMADVVRREGSQAYQSAIAGKGGGVDLRGATMNSFLGQKVLTDLLVMGMVGVYVDMPVVTGLSIAETQGKRPYLYCFQREDILSWSLSRADQESEFKSLLLRETVFNYDTITTLPIGEVQRYRLMWIDDLTGRVMVQFFDKEGKKVGPDSLPNDEPVMLELTRIPFVMFDIGDSLLKDVCTHQNALLQLSSADVNYAVKASFPFYVEQRDNRKVGHHLKQGSNEDGTATAGGQGAEDRAIKVGVMHGRAYDMQAEKPDFIHPSPEPLLANIKLEDKIEAEIRKLVNLAVSNLAPRASAESKEMDNQGLQNGLSFIGLILQAGESKIAEYWAAYEQREPTKRNIATIGYPTQYSLKSDLTRIEEANKLREAMNCLPSRTGRKEVAKTIATVLLSGKVSVEKLNDIHEEIDEAKYTNADPQTVIEAKNAGLVGEQVASESLGYEKNEYLNARKDHVARLERIAETQGQMNAGGDPASRGLGDLSGDPGNAGSEEKAASRDTTTKDTTEPRVRGDAK